MQPYAFPYLGYFQLLNLVDKFVLLDDVKFIKRGWINRNQILNFTQSKLFTIPVHDVNSSKRICDTKITYEHGFPNKLIRTIYNFYRRAPYFETSWPILEEILRFENNDLATFIRNSLDVLVDYLNIDTQIITTSSQYNNMELKGEERIIDICKKENAAEYINPEGGKLLYKNDNFEMQGIKLLFLEHLPNPYKQFGEVFVPNLSIIDVLMFNSQSDIGKLLNSFRLVRSENNEAKYEQSNYFWLR